MTSYLKPGETLQSRAEELMAELRTTPASAAVRREVLAHEIQGIGVLAATLPAAVATLESFDFVGERPDVVTIDDAVKAWDGALLHPEVGEGWRERARAYFLRALVGAEPEAAPYSFTPDVIRKVEDTLALQPNADGSTPRLPGEQSVATDPEPGVDFDAEIDDVGTRSDLDDLDPATIPDVGVQPEDDEDDPDLDDFAPQAKAKKKPETALSAMKKAGTKKETNR